jgi:cyclomaltodextrinase
MGLKQGRYRHFKGAEYDVKGLATHSETGEQLVVYSPLYGEGGLWVRPLTMFLETVEHEGNRRQRFEYIGGAEP